VLARHRIVPVKFDVFSRLLFLLTAAKSTPLFPNYRAYLGLKLNQKKLYRAAVELVSTRVARAENRLEDSIEHAHGNLARRRYFGYDMSWLEQAQGWCDAKSLIAVETISSQDNDAEHKVTSQWPYYDTVNKVL